MLPLGSKRQNGQDVLLGEFREVFQNFRGGHAAGEHGQHVVHRDAQIAHTGPPATFSGFEGDSVHDPSAPESGLWSIVRAGRFLSKLPRKRPLLQRGKQRIERGQGAAVGGFEGFDGGDVGGEGLLEGEGGDNYGYALQIGLVDARDC